jgi:hypothetical protein
MDDRDPAEAREALAKLEERLRRDARDMTEVLRADVPVFFVRAVRSAFEESPAADRLDDAALARLKAETTRRAQAATDALVRVLDDPTAWRWDRADAPPRDAKGLEPHPTVGPALARVGEAMGALLEEFGVGRDALGERAAYRLPSYFVGGHYMRSLVEGFWQALAAHHELAARLAEGESHDQRAARRSRWDQA